MQRDATPHVIVGLLFCSVVECVLVLIGGVK